MELQLKRELKYLAWLFAASSNIKTSEQQAKTGQKPLEHDFNANKGGEVDRERGRELQGGCPWLRKGGEEEAARGQGFVRVEQFI